MNTILVPVSCVNTAGQNTVIAPQILPPNLQPLYNLIETLSRKFGFAFARTRWLAERFQVSATYINRLLRRLVCLGRLVIQEIPNSHDRRFYPVPLPASFFDRKGSSSVADRFSKSRCTSIRPDSPTEKRQDTCAPLPVPASATLGEENAGTQAENHLRNITKMIGMDDKSTAGNIEGTIPANPETKPENNLAADLESRGMWTQTARYIARTVPEKQVRKAIQYFDIVKAFRKIEQPGAYLKRLAVKGDANVLDLSQVGVGGRDPGRKREVERAPQEPKPDKSTMYATYVPEEWMRDEPMKAPPTLVQGSVGASEDDLALLPPAVAATIRRRREGLQ